MNIKSIQILSSSVGKQVPVMLAKSGDVLNRDFVNTVVRGTLPGGRQSIPIEGHIYFQFQYSKQTCQWSCPVQAPLGSVMGEFRKRHHNWHTLLNDNVEPWQYLEEALTNYQVFLSCLYFKSLGTLTVCLSPEVLSSFQTKRTKFN